MLEREIKNDGALADALANSFAEGKHCGCKPATCTFCVVKKKVEGAAKKVINTVTNGAAAKKEAEKKKQAAQTITLKKLNGKKEVIAEPAPRVGGYNTAEGVAVPEGKYQLAG